MSFNSNKSRVEYVVTSNTTTTYSFNFKIFENTDVVVYKVPSGTTPDDTIHKLSLTSDYTVTINGEDGGFIELVNNPTMNDLIIIQRILPIDRTVSYSNNGGIYSDVLNNDQDYQTYLISDFNTEKENYFKLPFSVTGVNTTMPAPIAERYMRWNEDGTALVNDTNAPTWLVDAKGWAITPQGELFTDSIGDTDYSSKHYALYTSERLDTVQTNGQTVENNLDTIMTYDNELVTTVTNIGDVVIVSDNIASVNTNTTNIADINTNATNIANINTNALNIVDINAIASNMTDITYFADIYQGPKTIDPTTRNDTSPLQIGDLYFNTADGVMKTYEGTVWLVTYASLSGTLVAANNLSDVSSVEASRTNLDVYSKTEIDSLKTPTPTVSISTSVNESADATGIITNYDSDTTYIFTATNGSINYKGGNTFVYTAPDVTDGDNDIDTLSVYVTKAGELRSDISTTTITVVYVSLVADETIQVVDFTGEASVNDGFDKI